MPFSGDPFAARLGTSFMSESAPRTCDVTDERRAATADYASPCCGYAVLADGPAGSAYGEEAFRYLLGIERKRAERSSRPFLMLLVDLKCDDGGVHEMNDETSAAVFSGMSRALRETDFIGWYREGRVAGAVLAQHGDAPDGIADVVSKRVAERIGRQLPSSAAGRVQTRIFQIPRGSRE